MHELWQKIQCYISYFLKYARNLFVFRKGSCKVGRKDRNTFSDCLGSQAQDSLGILCMSLCSHGCNKAFQAWICSRLSSSPCSFLLSVPPAQQMSFPLLSAMWRRVRGQHHLTYFVESNKKILHAITFPKLLEAVCKEFFF